MLILALDSSSAACSVAIARDGGIIARESAQMVRGHAAALPPMISRVLRKTDLAARDVDAFAVSTGPGSFTGLRVAMAAAKGLAVASGRPLIGISCFDAVARKAIDMDKEAHFDVLLVALASKRVEIFVQASTADGQPIISDEVLAPEEIDRRLGEFMGEDKILYVAGEAGDLVLDTLRGPEARCRAGFVQGVALPPDASQIAILADERITTVATPLERYVGGLDPIYLRPPATTIAKP